MYWEVGKQHVTVDITGHVLEFVILQRTIFLSATPIPLSNDPNPTQSHTYTHRQTNTQTHPQVDSTD